RGDPRTRDRRSRARRDEPRRPPTHGSRDGREGMTLTTERPADAPARETEPRIRVRDLTVGFTTSAGHREIVRDVSFDLYAGRCLAIVGESGSGKSVTARTLVGLTGRGARVDATELSLDGDDLRGFTERRWREGRGRRSGGVRQAGLGARDPLRGP